MNPDNVTSLDIPKLRQAYQSLSYEGPEPDFVAATQARASRPWLMPAAAAAVIALVLVGVMSYGPQATRTAVDGGREWAATPPLGSAPDQLNAHVSQARERLSQLGVEVSNAPGVLRPQRPSRLVLARPTRWSPPAATDVG